MKRGSLVWVNLEDATPPEFGKVRPGLIISSTLQNTILQTVVILPISTKPPEIPPLRLQLRMPNGKNSFVVIPGIRQVNKSRLLETIGQTSPEVMKAVEKAVFAYLMD